MGCGISWFKYNRKGKTFCPRISQSDLIIISKNEIKKGPIRVIDCQSARPSPTLNFYHNDLKLENVQMITKPYKGAGKGILSQEEYIEEEVACW